MPPPHLDSARTDALVPDAARRARASSTSARVGRELPWTQPAADDPFSTYEGWIDAPAGTLSRGHARTARQHAPHTAIRCIRAEHPAHDYLRRIAARCFRATRDVASFLRRYLAIFEGFLGEIEARGDRPRRAARFALRRPMKCCRGWRASSGSCSTNGGRAPRGRVGAPRTRAATSSRPPRGSSASAAPSAGLKRFIELYTGVPVVLVEHFRLRGLGGAILGDTGAAFSSSVLGGGFRVGGAVGAEGAAPLTGDIDDAFRTHAHRFSVVIPAMLKKSSSRW